MDVRGRWRDDPHMPLELTDEELATAECAARIAAEAALTQAACLTRHVSNYFVQRD